MEKKIPLSGESFPKTPFLKMNCKRKNPQEDFFKGGRKKVQVNIRTITLRGGIYKGRDNF